MLSGVALRSIKIKGKDELQMAYENLKLAKSAATDEIYLGRVSTDGTSWVSGKRNMTQDFLQCVMDRWMGYTETITAGDRKFEISVKEIT
jgi:hypothetical protein